jgi:hypothetical protein
MWFYSAYTVIKGEKYAMEAKHIYDEWTSLCFVIVGRKE